MATYYRYNRCNWLCFPPIQRTWICFPCKIIQLLPETLAIFDFHNFLFTIIHCLLAMTIHRYQGSILEYNNSKQLIGVGELPNLSLSCYSYLYIYLLICQKVEIYHFIRRLLYILCGIYTMVPVYVSNFCFHSSCSSQIIY